MALVREARDKRWDDLREIYARFLPLIVYEQQPGVAVRKEIYRLRGLITSSCVRHPGASIDAETAEQLERVIKSELPGVDIAEPLVV